MYFILSKRDIADLKIFLAVLPALLCVSAIALRRFWLRRSFPLPPGPRGYPLIGNLLDMPDCASTKAWEIFASWGKQYGKLTSMRLPGRTIIIVNDLDVAVNMLVKNGAIYSDRPKSAMINLSGYDRYTVNLPNNSQLRAHRKLLAKFIGTPQSVSKFYKNYEYQACMLLKRLLMTPDPLEDVVKRSTVAMQLDFAYGYRVQEKNDPLVSHLEQIQRYTPLIVRPGHFLVDAFPVLRFLPDWFPGTRFKSVADQAKTLAEFLGNDPFNAVRDQVAAGTNRSSLLSDVLSTGGLTEDNLHNLKWITNTLYSAGSSTLEATLLSFFLAMTAYPAVQRKLQEELDHIVGRQRLPKFSDRSSLPYAQAVAKELLRWMTASPLGIIHVLSTDDIQEGYHIPQGSCIIVNAWQILHDSRYYKDPFVFKPERFLGPRPELDPEVAAFGFGRRICPGVHVTNAWIWIAVVTCAASLDMQKPITSEGVQVGPICDQLPGITSRPLPFKCNIRPRHDDLMRLIEESLINSEVNY